MCFLWLFKYKKTRKNKKNRDFFKERILKSLLNDSIVKTAGLFILRKRKRSKYSYDLFIEMIKRHIKDRTSLRVIAKRLRETTHSKLSSFTVFNAVKRASLNSKLLIEIIKELNPSLTGFLHLDGKAIKIKGGSKHFLTLFISFDSKGFPYTRD